MNRYHEGNYAPIQTETTAADLSVTGRLPEELTGLYVRNGPDPLPGSPTDRHWFLGDGMVHGVRLDGGRASWYRSRYVGGDRVDKALGRTTPGPNWNDSAGGPNTHVGRFAGRIYAMVEAGGTPVELTPELETVGRSDFGGTLAHGFTAHPKYDPATGELHAMAYAWGQLLDHLEYVVVGPDGAVVRTVDIPMGMSMVHDMSLTERYAVVYDLPVTIDVEEAIGGAPFPFRWDPDHGSRVGLLPRDGGADDIVWCDAPLGYVFHPVNAYDDADGTVVVDVPYYERMFDRDRLGPFGDSLPALERWVIDPARRTVSATRIDDRPIEFPRHDPRVGTRRHRFSYGAGVDPDHGRWPTYKVDHDTGTFTGYDHGPGRGTGEPVFVPKADSGAEDDGWLISLIHDVEAGSAELAVLDANDIAEGPVATVHLPTRVPYGFHGSWLADPTT